MEIALNQEHSALSSNRLASRRLQRALAHINRAGRQLDAAGEASNDKLDREHFRSLASGLRELYLPLCRTASRLEKGGAR